MDKGPGTLRLEVWKGWLLLLHRHSLSQKGSCCGSDPFLKLWRKVEAEGEGRREIYKVIFQTPNQPTLLDWAIVSFPSTRWSLVSRIPWRFILFCSTSVERKQGIHLKFHFIHARTIRYCMKVLFTRKSIRGGISLVQRSPSTRAQAPGETWPGEGRIPARRCCLPSGQAVCRAVGTIGDSPRVGRHASFPRANPVV